MTPTGLSLIGGSKGGGIQKFWDSGISGSPLRCIFERVIIYCFNPNKYVVSCN